MNVFALPTIHTLLAPVAIAASFYLPANADGAEAEILFSFENPDSTKTWNSVNDGVMGGRSKGGFKRVERKTLLFTGDLSLENGGGFASIRTDPRALNLGDASGIIVKARGDGRTYRVQLRTDDRMATSYRANLPTAEGGFSEVLIPFSDFQLQVFGNVIPGSEPINPAAINSIGFSVADKKAGPFEFELESVKIFRGKIERPVEANSDAVKPAIQEASYIDHSLTIVSYHPPLPAKLARMTEMDGPARMLNSRPSASPRIVFNDSGPAPSMTDFVYVQQGPGITVYDAKGREQRSFEVPPEVQYYVSFTVLPEGGIAFLDNRNDAIYFVDKDGEHLKTVAISDEPDRKIQNMKGIVVDDQLIVSENGYNELLSVDLKNYELSVFRSLKQLGGWLGAITYSDGAFYLCQSREIYTFTSESEEIKKLATTPKGNLTGAVVSDGRLLVEANGKWKRPAEERSVYEIELKSGIVAEITSDLDIPEGLMLLKAMRDRSLE